MQDDDFVPECAVYIHSRPIPDEFFGLTARGGFAVNFGKTLDKARSHMPGGNVCWNQLRSKA
jgi:hypothetical protein